MDNSLSFLSLTRCERAISVKYVLHDEYWLGRVQSTGGIRFLYGKVSFAQSASRGVDRMDGFTGYTNICPKHTHWNTRTNSDCYSSASKGVSVSKQGDTHLPSWGVWVLLALLGTRKHDERTHKHTQIATVKISAAQWSLVNICLHDLVVFLTLRFKSRLIKFTFFC